IKRKTRGFYTLVDFCGAGELVSELERFFRIDDRVLKFMSVMLAEKVDLEEIRREMAEAASRTTADEGLQASETASEAKETSTADTEEEA
ncbi:MAG: 30S ribosomal protein S6, partial [Desulfobacterales bacterium]|nr:30S ribosomal protein S6 [Desulfobacterales bacterium]